MRRSVLLGLLVFGAAHAGALDVHRPLPPDLMEPEGRTRWDLTDTPRLADQATRLPIPATDRAALRPGERRVRPMADGTEAEIVTVGVGWVHLPSGPREVALQRVRLHGRTGNVLVHRWVDPDAGTVAEIRGPAGPDGRRLAITDGYVVDSRSEERRVGKGRRAPG